MIGNCALCRRYTNLEEHHVFSGPYRKKSTKYHATIHICRECHTGKNGIQFNRPLADEVKAVFQERIMKQQGWDIPRFIREFGKNYIKEKK